ncbi:MAG: hypothetical protein EA397_19515 [Deltaproteobacteria bacterium]|nr:MAG: hypothetical protein EA397_19515 [Deltaproteobacteria bacterium]
MALRLGQPDYAYFEHTQIEAEVVQHLAACRWSERIRQAPAVILEVPPWLDRRVGVCRLIVNLINDRAADGLRTIICQPADARTIDQIMSQVDPSQIVVLGLRFPQGRRGRKRVARRMAAERNLPDEAAVGTEKIDPWSYAQVLARLEAWSRENPDRRRD